MHQVCIAVGKRASGKSTAVVNLIERMQFDYVIAVSPTISSNKELMDRLKIKHVFEDCDDPDIVDKIARPRTPSVLWLRPRVRPVGLGLALRTEPPPRRSSE